MMGYRLRQEVRQGRVAVEPRALRCERGQVGKGQRPLGCTLRQPALQRAGVEQF
jgi:hypothetical protein